MFDRGPRACRRVTVPRYCFPRADVKEWRIMRRLLPRLAVIAVIAVVAGVVCAPLAARQAAAPPPPIVKENATVKVGPHTFVIPDNNVGLVPNVGIIVGSRERW